MSFLGEWKVNDVKPSASGEAQEVKVKVRINHNGILLISSAQMIEKKDAQDEAQNGTNENEIPSPGEPPATPEGQAPTGEPMDTTQDVSLCFVSRVIPLQLLPPCISTNSLDSPIHICLTLSVC